MPKIVDHDARRREIISKVWRLISEEGIDAVTTRRIADVTGYANGLLRYYFPSKDSVVSEALRFVMDATAERADGGRPRRGLLGLRALAEEILPIDDLRRTEARVSVALWHRALNSPEFHDVAVERFAAWREDVLARLEEAEADGEVRSGLDRLSAGDNLMSMLLGTRLIPTFDATRDEAQYRKGLDMLIDSWK